MIKARYDNLFLPLRHNRVAITSKTANVYDVNALRLHRNRVAITSLFARDFTSLGNTYNQLITNIMMPL